MDCADRVAIPEGELHRERNAVAFHLLLRRSATPRIDKVTEDSQ